MLCNFILNNLNCFFVKFYFYFRFFKKLNSTSKWRFQTVILEINTKLFVNITTINTELKPTRSQENSMFIYKLSYLKKFNFFLLKDTLVSN